MSAFTRRASSAPARGASRAPVHQRIDQFLRRGTARDAADPAIGASGGDGCGAMSQRLHDATCEEFQRSGRVGVGRYGDDRAGCSSLTPAR
jgi:hypothetical protein